MGYLIVSFKDLPTELVPMYSDCKILQFRDGLEYRVQKRKSKLILSHEHFDSSEKANVEYVSFSVQNMIEKRIDDIRHQRSRMDRLVLQACNDPSSVETINEELALCFGIVQVHLAALKDNELFTRPVEYVETKRSTRITLRPGNLSNIGTNGSTVLWTPCRTMPEPVEVITTHDTTVSSMVPLEIPLRTRSILVRTLDEFDA